MLDLFYFLKRQLSFMLATVAAVATVATAAAADDDDEDEIVVSVEKLVLLHGGVTAAHIRATIRSWCGMLLLNQEFFEGPTVDATDGDEDE